MAAFAFGDPGLTHSRSTLGRWEQVIEEGNFQHLPSQRSDKTKRGDRHAILEAHGHHLVDAQAGQRPTGPHHYRYAQNGFGEEVHTARQIGQETRDRPAGRLGSVRPAKQIEHGDRTMPPSEEQDGGQATDQQHGSVLGHEEVAPPQSGVLGEKTGHQFAFRFGQVERCSVHTGQRTREIDSKHGKGEWIMKNQPIAEPTGLHVGDGGQIHCAGQQHGNDDTDPQRHLITDHLRRFTHGPKQRPFRARSVTREDRPKHFQAQHGQNKKDRDIRIKRHPAIGERQSQEGREAGGETDIGSQPKQHLVGVARSQVLFGNQFNAVRQSLQPAEFATHSCGTESILNAARNLAFHPDKQQGRHRHQSQNQSTVDRCGQQISQRRGQRQYFGKKVGHSFVPYACVLPQKPAAVWSLSRR